MQRVAFGILFYSIYISVVPAHAQQTFSVGINAECKAGQGLLLGASTYHPDPFCYSYATAPGGGCTQWKLFRDGQLVTSRYTVPVGGSQVSSNPPLDFYNAGNFTILTPGTYQIKMTYSRLTCSGWWIFQTCSFTVYANETPPTVVTSNDLDPASWLNKCPLGSFDLVNCFVMAKPSGGFVLDRGFYMPASKSSNCPVGHYDNENCFLMAKPGNGFIWDNGFYVTPDVNGNCSIGHFDGRNCFLVKAPPGTNAFEFDGNFYVTPLPSCPQGSYDGANCLLASAPLGTNPFELDGKFYVTPRKPCH